MFGLSRVAGKENRETGMAEDRFPHNELSLLAAAMATQAEALRGAGDELTAQLLRQRARALAWMAGQDERPSEAELSKPRLQN